MGDINTMSHRFPHKGILLGVTGLVILGAFGSLAPAETAGPGSQELGSVYRAEPGSRVLSNPRAYEIDFGIRFTPPAGAKLVRIWLVKPQSAEDQFVANLHYVAPPTAEGVEPVNGNQFLYYEYRSPTGPVEPRIRYTVLKYDLRVNVDPAKVRAPKAYPPELKKYLGSEQRIVVNDDIRTLAHQIAGDEKNPYLVSLRFFNWIVDNIKYGHEDRKSVV